MSHNRCDKQESVVNGDGHGRELRTSGGVGQTATGTGALHTTAHRDRRARAHLSHLLVAVITSGAVVQLEVALDGLLQVVDALQGHLEVAPRRARLRLGNLQPLLQRLPLLHGLRLARAQARVLLADLAQRPGRGKNRQTTGLG